MKQKVYEKDRAMTYAEVGRLLGITRQRVEQIERNALKKLNSPELREQWFDIMDTLEMLNRKDIQPYTVGTKRSNMEYLAKEKE